MKEYSFHTFKGTKVMIQCVFKLFSLIEIQAGTFIFFRLIKINHKAFNGFMMHPSHCFKIPVTIEESQFNFVCAYANFKVL